MILEVLFLLGGARADTTVRPTPFPFTPEIDFHEPRRRKGAGSYFQ